MKHHEYPYGQQWKERRIKLQAGVQIAFRKGYEAALKAASGAFHVQVLPVRAGQGMGFQKVTQGTHGM